MIYDFPNCYISKRNTKVKVEIRNSRFKNVYRQYSRGEQDGYKQGMVFNLRF